MPLCVALLRKWHACVGFWTGAGVPARIAAAAIVAAVIVFSGAAIDYAGAARPARAEVSAKIANGFARLVLHFSEDVESDAHLANNIIIVSFRAPVALQVDRLNELLPGIVSAARRDPDGRGMRIALAQRVKMNAMQAGERLFIDLMPANWSGPPPALPNEVIEELARRAREAEKRLQRQQALRRQRQQPAIRVRVGNQPTFSRYVFDLNALVPVVTSREKNTLTLVFDAPLKFDLADVKVALPPMVESIDAQSRDQSTAVRIALIGNVDVRTFREDASFVVDVSIVEQPKPAAEAAAQRGGGGARAHRAGAGTPKHEQASAAAIEAPRTVPVDGAKPPAPEQFTTVDLAAAASNRHRPDADPRAAPAAEPRADPPAPPANATQPSASTSHPVSPVPAQAELRPAMPQSVAPLAPIAAPPPMLPVFDIPGIVSLPPANAPFPAMAPPPPAAEPERKAESESKHAPERDSATAPSAASAPEPKPAPTAPPAVDVATQAQVPAAAPPQAAAPVPPPAVQATTADQPTSPPPVLLPGLVIADLELPPGYVSPGAPRATPARSKPAASKTAATKPASAEATSAKSEPVKAEPKKSPPSQRKAGNVPGAKVTLAHHGDDLVMTFGFAVATPTAVFQRADTVWIVFDAQGAPDIAPLTKDASETVASARLVGLPNGQAVALKLTRPQLTAVRFDGTAVIVTLGDSAKEPPHPLVVTRETNGGHGTTATIPFEGVRTVHRLTDPEVGDTLLVVTALGPPRGFLRSQSLIDFRALPSSHGVAISADADDLTAAITADKIVLARPNGLNLSTGDAVVRRLGSHRVGLFDPQLWGFDRQADFNQRQARLIDAAADASDNKRTALRLELARFYLARGLYPEAKGVLDVALSEDKPTEDPSSLVMRAFAEIMIGHVDEGLKDLADPIVGSQHDSRIWRGLAFARQGNWSEAHDNLRDVETAITPLPIELQRLLLQAAVRASIEVHDYAAAADHMHGFETLGVTKEMEPALAVLAGRIAEGVGHSADALANYRLAAASPVRPAAAQGRLRETALRYHLDDLKRSEVITDLEELTTVWRGDETEIEALQILARLYTEDARYRDAFHVMRTALMAHPNSDMTRRIQEEASKTFDELFLTKSGDVLPAIDALGLFYDFRDLTPIGRRGDEMVRRLSDRLVAVDLLDQAAELLQHQVDHRLQGAARAQVAIRLAVIYLMNRKPGRALAVLRDTQGGGLANRLRRQRLLLEARALSDVGRPELALEVIANIDAAEAKRLRADILWAARRWREAAEQIELRFGDRWRDWQPFTDAERCDLLRAAVGYALAKDKLGLERFRERFAAKMTTTPDRHAFEIATKALHANSVEFRTLAHAIASGNTLDGFLRELGTRYPETGAFSSRPTHASPTRAAQADSKPTGSITRPPLAKVVR